MSNEAEQEKILEQFGELLKKPTQPEWLNKMLEEYYNFFEQGGKRSDWENKQLAGNLEELIEAISMVTEEWKKGGGGSPEEDFLSEIHEGKENVDRDETIRVFEWPLIKQLSAIVDEIPLNKIEDVLAVISEEKIRVWDDDRAKKLAQEIRQKLLNKKENLL